ncbi:MAG: S8 family serine peptidase [Acidilobaceae archaeon]
MLRALLSALLLLAVVAASLPPVAAASESWLGREELRAFLREEPSGGSRRLIVLGSAGLERALELVELRGGRVLERFELLGGAVVEADELTEALLKSLGFRVYQDRVLGLVRPLRPPAALEPYLSAGAPSIGAPIAWSMGFDGSGVRVAVVDTGVENSHPWLVRGGASVVKWEADATRTGVVDYCGFRTGFHEGGVHGTHVAGIIASQHPAYRGVAPGVDIYDIIVFSEELGCLYTYESIVIAGIALALLGPDGVPETGDEADVINLSLGFIAPPWLQHAIKEGAVRLAIIDVLEEAVRRGKIVVVAAGNAYGLNMVNALCLAEGVICVGASSHMGTPHPGDDVLAWFSSKGPGPLGSLLPHVVAPGVYIYSSVPTALGVEGDLLSGTSMAAPFVSGAAAILVSYYRSMGLSWSPLVVRAALAQTAIDVRPQSIDSLWLLPDDVKELLRPYVPEPPVATPADQGGGLVQVHSAMSAEVLILSPEGDQAIAVTRPGLVALELYALNTAGERVVLEASGVVELIEVHSLNRRVSGVVEPSRVEIQPGRSAALRLLVSVDRPGVYAGYVKLASAESGRVYRVPVLVAVYFVIDRDTALVQEDLVLMTRDAWDVVNVYLRVAYAPRAGLAAVTLSFPPVSTTPPTVVAITAPSGWHAYAYGSAGVFPLAEPGVHVVSVFHPVSIHPPLVESRLVVAPHDPAGLAERTRLLESRLASLETALSALELSLRTLRSHVDSLRAELDSVRADVARVSAALEKARESLSALESQLAAARRDLDALRSQLAALDKALSQRLEESAARVSALEAQAGELRAAILELEKRAESLTSELEETRSQLSATSIASYAALALSIAGLAVATASLLLRRKAA